MAIHWDQLLHGGYTDLTTMLDTMYKEFGSEERVAKKLGVSKWAVHKKRAELGLVNGAPFGNERGNGNGRPQLAEAYG